MRRLKTMTSHRWWYEQSSRAGLRHGKKLIFLFHRSNLGGGSGFMISICPRFRPTTSGLTHAWAGVRLLVLKWPLDFPRNGPSSSMNNAILFFIHWHVIGHVFLTFFYGRDGIRNLIFFLYHPPLINVSRIRPSLRLTGEVGLPK